MPRLTMAEGVRLLRDEHGLRYSTWQLRSTARDAKRSGLPISPKFSTEPTFTEKALRDFALAVKKAKRAREEEGLANAQPLGSR
ncbi:MAG: hypothetical protein ACK5TN_09125 [Acidobacteriota bacterium]|jgi:hypothetical protein